MIRYIIPFCNMNIYSIIYHSIIHGFRVDFDGRGELHDRQHKIGAAINMVSQMAATFSLAVVFTNQVNRYNL